MSVLPLTGLKATTKFDYAQALSSPPLPSLLHPSPLLSSPLLLAHRLRDVQRQMILSLIAKQRALIAQLDADDAAELAAEQAPVAV